MLVRLSNSKPSQSWENSWFSFNNDEFTIHSFNKEIIQKSARKFRTMGIKDAELIGDNWTLEACWAFYQGFYTPKQDENIRFDCLKSKEDNYELFIRIRCADFIRNIINKPAEIITPIVLAEKTVNFIKEISSEYQPEAKITSKIISGEQLLEHKFNGIWAVGKGSYNPPAMLQLDFNPTNDDNAPIFACLVGKGITFDSGGYSIKPSSSMITMRSDMGGSALLTGALAMAIACGLNKRIKLILCCAENMISGQSMRLGDIINYKNNISVEITNTDAEGRLVLADGLIFACEQNPNIIIDVATLTGAAKSAVGNDYHSILTMDDKLANELLKSANEEEELFWRLPFAEFHRQQTNSVYADLANSSPLSVVAGASVATAFLSYFVKNYQKNWLHIDASATFRPSATDSWANGATGIGIKTLANFLINNK